MTPCEWVEQQKGNPHRVITRIPFESKLQEGREPNWVTVNQTVWNWNRPNRMPKWNRWDWNWTEPEPSEPDFGVDIGAEKIIFGPDSSKNKKMGT